MKNLAIALAVVFFVIAVLYVSGIVQFATSDPAPGKRHLGHFALFAVLGVLSLVWARFQSARTAS